MRIQKFNNYYEILQGDALDVLKKLPSESVHCVITSIPYWAMRVYDIAPQWWEIESAHQNHYHDMEVEKADKTKGAFCSCGAWFGCLGLEPDLDLFVDHIVLIFKEVKRVLRHDGTLWLNIGDCYGQGGARANKQKLIDDRRRAQEKGYASGAFAGTSKGQDRAAATIGGEIKAKDLCGQPWRVAFALRADGWHLRSDIIWMKRNALPESVKDRPSKQHEYIFLLSKSKKYYYDRFGIQEPISAETGARYLRAVSGNHKYTQGAPGQGIQRGLDGARPNRTKDRAAAMSVPSKRNKRTVWDIPTNSFKGAHFAAFPLALPATCLLAGTSEKGCCVTCEAPFERVTRPSAAYASRLGKAYNHHMEDLTEGHKIKAASVTSDYLTVGWRPTCGHYQAYYDSMPLAKNPRKRARQIAARTRVNRLKRAPLLGDYPTKPCVVLDPFMGAGTSALAALINGRDALGIELSEKYIEIAHKRILEAEMPRAKISKMKDGLKFKRLIGEQLCLFAEEEVI